MFCSVGCRILVNYGETWTVAKQVCIEKTFLQFFALWETLKAFSTAKEL